LLFRFAEFGNIELLYSTMYVVAVLCGGGKMVAIWYDGEAAGTLWSGVSPLMFVTHLVGQSVSVVSSLLCFDFIDDENDFFTVYRFSLFIFAYFINLCFVGCFFWF